MSMSIDVAKEHIKDGADCIKEAIRSLRRVRKNYPASAQTLEQAETHLAEAESLLRNPDQVIPAEASVKP